VKNTCENTINYVETSGSRPEDSVLSPMLFVVVMNVTESEKNKGSRFESFYIRRYHEGGEDVKELQTRLSHEESVSKGFKLYTNIQKTVMLELSRNGGKT
jgi:ribosomal protein L19